MARWVFVALGAVLAVSLSACAGARLSEDPLPSGVASDSVELVPSEVVPTAEVCRATLRSDCRLPCERGCAPWSVRGVYGRGFFVGDDEAEGCSYYGIDIGRTLCRCWGIDAFFRRHSGRFDRAVTTTPPGGAPITSTGLDAGYFNHFGLKATQQRSFRGSRLYWWAGLGAEYFWTEDYLNNDDGFGLFGEAGLGFNVSNRWRIRAGVNVHGMDTDAGRLSPADDDQGRWLMVIAPVIQLEASF